jgi:hypothetical protein
VISASLRNFISLDFQFIFFFLLIKELETLQELLLKLKEIFGRVLGKTQNLQYFIVDI